jgi:mRNA-degrading endonuclease toxin of MazEF toxin-antitoxin module
MLDTGLAAKVRTALVLTTEAADHEQALVTVANHTTQVDPANPWTVSIPKTWLKEGVFHMQQVGTFPLKYLVRKMGSVTPEEFAKVKLRLALRLGI